ncbi:MAG: DEAD/DEAH box helicase [Vampirovibrio sp.]|nr:DEAD/DEAH box helicase [Vampirovibrio sp.]
MTILDIYHDIMGGFANYEPRKAQELMVERVSNTLDEYNTLVVEAGTGSGKSFGYLIPALFQKRKPIVISTGTIALQEQLLHKDIPFLAEAAGLDEMKVRLVKGRGNYLCIQKLLDLEREIKGVGPELLHIQYLKGELDRGWDGDAANLDIAVPRELWEEVKSDTEDCLGHRCQFFKENPYRQAREDLDKADIIISNHALYLQDLVNGQTLLPSHDIVIFDEAHHLKHYALSALTGRIGKYATTKLLRKINRRLMKVPDAFLQQIHETEAGMLEWLFRADANTFRLKPDEMFFSLVTLHKEVLTELNHWLGAVKVDQLPLVENDIEADRASVQKNKLINQLQGLLVRWEYFLSENPFEDQRVNWVTVDKNRLYYELKSTPLNVADTLAETLWPEKSAILTSATLSVNRSLQFFKADLGLASPTGSMAPQEQANESSTAASDLILPSPFNYQEQCVLYVPNKMPEPNDPAFAIAVAQQVEEILPLTQGRAFVLFTSYSNMQAVSQALIPNLPYPCKVQGDLPRNKLIDWFKTTDQSVLFATATFWEGIDIPGEALSCVIMDKIPFASPEDPVNQATTDYLKAQGRDWFSEYVLPQAVIRLKQGFGRLIRSQEDTGLVAILDPRLRTKGYGKRIINSLPKVKVIDTLEAYQPVTVQS